MAGTVNKVILIGNLGKDPEYRMLENGSSVANFPVATSEVYIDKNGNKVEHTDWHDIVVWGNLADIAEKYIKKGYKVYIEGKLKKRNWQDKDGQTRYSVDIVANELSILSRPENQEQKTDQSPYSTDGTPPAPSRIDSIISNADDKPLPF